MINIRILLTILIFSLSACGQKSGQHKINQDAVRLNDKATKLLFSTNNTDSIRKAIGLLDSATSLDSNYFLGYYNKLIFLNKLREYKKAIITTNQLIRLRPNANDFYFTGGILSEKTGDSISSQDYFQKSLEICNKSLDTMSVQNRGYQILAISKALDLIMLDQQTSGNLLLKRVYETEADSLKQEWIHSFMDKSKSEIIEMILNPPVKEASASAEIDDK